MPIAKTSHLSTKFSTRLSVQHLGVVVLAICGTAASADIVDDLFMIDSFGDAFEGESFVGSYSNGTANSLYIANGLEVGYVLLGDEYSAGDAHPGFTTRGQEVQYQAGLDGVLGGVRQSELVATSALGSAVTIRAGGERLSFNTSFGTQAQLNLIYDGGSQLNQNFTSILDGAFHVKLLNGDMLSSSGRERPVPIEVRLTSGFGTADERSFAVGSTLLASGVDHLFDFSDFDGVDFSDIDRVSLFIDQSDEVTRAVDFQISSFGVVGTRAIPAPGGLALLLGTGAVMLRRRR